LTHWNNLLVDLCITSFFDEFFDHLNYNFLYSLNNFNIFYYNNENHVKIMLNLGNLFNKNNI